MRKRLSVLLMGLLMMVMSAAPALVAPPQDGHACYGYEVYSLTHGEDVALPEPVSGHPGNEQSAFQQGAREELAN